MARTALLSVSDKRGIEKVARKLAELEFTLLSTGGTAEVLRKSGIPVTPVEQVTGFPECLGGRMKTVHPTLLGGILYRRGDNQHEREVKEHGMVPIDLVIVNLYPFGAAAGKLASSGRTKEEWLSEAVEQIDIGGPTLLRSAAKNFESVTAVCDPDDYDQVLTQLEHGGPNAELKRSLAAKVFLHTAGYDALIAECLSDGLHAGVMLTAGRTLRYGENPHQWGKFFELYDSSPRAPEKSAFPPCAQWKQLQGKEVSYLNLLDADAAWRMASDFSEPTAVFVKHLNPSGIASHEDIAEAFQRAYDSDRLSAFGVVIALNRTCTEAIAQKIIDQNIFTEVLLAKSFEPAALDVLRSKPNMRAIDMDGTVLSADAIYRSALGGMLVQNDDTRAVTEQDLTIVTKYPPTPGQIRDLLFAWKAVKHAKSNAIVFASDRVTVGIGSGQTSRVDATWIAAKRAGAKAKGAVMASDAFFPFADSLEEAAKHGIAAIIQPGGSIRDREVIAKADELGISMVLTGVRAFRH